MSKKQPSAPHDPWKDAIEAYERLTEYTAHRRGCSFDRSDFCDCGLHALKPGALIDAARAADATRHQAELIEQRVLGHGEGQEHTIADVNAGRIDDMIAPRLEPLQSEIATLRATVDAARHQQEIAALTQERDALLNYYWKANHLAGNVELEAAEARCAILTAALEELYATVKGECPSLLNEDSGGSAQLDAQVSAALAAAPQGNKL